MTGANSQRSLAAVEAFAALGDAVAVIGDDGSAVTYATLASQARTVAEQLGGERRLVQLVADNTLAALVAYLGCLAGGHPVLLTPSGRIHSVAALADTYDPDVVIRAQPAAEPILDVRRRRSRHRLHPDLALLLPTSGSTGAQKLVRLSQQNLDANAHAIMASLGTRPADRAATTLPMHYCYGLSVVNSHLLAGATLLLTKRSVVDPCFWTHFRAYGGTTFAGVPHTFDLLDRTRFERMQLPTLRYVTQAGGRLAPERVRRYAELGANTGWDFVVMYGQTEATARMAYLPPELAREHPGAIGIPIPGGSFTIAPVEGVAAEADAGELVYRGPNVMLGYAHGPDDLALGRTVTELRTGDIGRRQPDGLYEVVGRVGRFVKPFGLRIDLDRVEQVLAGLGYAAACTGDDDVIVIGLDPTACSCTGTGTHPETAIDPETRTRTGEIAATTTPASATTTDANEQVASIVDSVTDRFGLPRSAVHVAVFATGLPRLTSGKTDYVTILAATRQPRTAPNALTAPQVSPATTPRGTVRAVFALVLGCNEIPDDATFVRLGGDSLSYVETSLLLEDALVTLPDTWHLMPVHELDALVRADAATDATATPQPRDTSARLVHRPHWRWHSLRPMDTTVFLRALGIFLVVAAHTHLTDIQGGAHVLLAVAGYNYARFRLSGTDTATDTATELRHTARSLTRLALPTVALVAALLLLTDGFRLSNLLLVHNYVGDGRWRFWFIEALVHIGVALAIVFSIPSVRRAERRQPYFLAVAVVVAALAIRSGALGIGRPLHTAFTTHSILWLFALGWATQRATSLPRRLLVSLLAVIGVAGFFDDPFRDGVVLAGLLALTWWPRIRVPHPLYRPVGVLAAASLAIYLSHWEIWPMLQAHATTEVATVVTLLAGVAIWATGRRIAPRASALARRAATLMRFSMPRWFPPQPALHCPGVEGHPNGEQRLGPILAQRDRPRFQAYSRWRRRPPHQGTVVSGMSAERTGE